MAVANASLGALGVARDNNANTSVQTSLAKPGATNVNMAVDYEVTFVSLNFTTKTWGGIDTYTIVIAGGSRIGELQSSAHLNTAASVFNGTILTLNNTTLQIQWGAPTSKQSIVQWNDGFNTMLSFSW
jgi:hypothetical protein